MQAVTSLITCLQAPQGTMKSSPMSLPKEKGTELRARSDGGGTPPEDLHAPINMEPQQSSPQFLQKTMQKPTSLPNNHPGSPSGAPGVFPLAPRPVPRLYLVMAMALKLLCPSEMAFRMAARSAHIPRL